MLNKKEEALWRMRQLKMMPHVITQFERDGKLYYSETTELGGIPYELCLHPQWQKLVEDFQKENDMLVYHVICERFPEGQERLTFLYVSPFYDEWDVERNDILQTKEGLGHVLYAAECDPKTGKVHFGCIVVRENGSGLSRIA